jgi:hypothetical protein
MMRTTPRSPAHVLKRREVEAVTTGALPRLSGGAEPPSGPPAALPARCVAKTARLIDAGPDLAAVEVRCSCGEATRVELRLAPSREGARP